MDFDGSHGIINYHIFKLKVIGAHQTAYKIGKFPIVCYDLLYKEVE